LGKGSTVLGIIALILGAGGLGLGGLAWISVSRVETQVANLSEQNTWYKYNDTVLKCDPIQTYLTFTGLTIEFELGPNESVYFSFTSRGHTEQNLGAWSRIFVIFRVDGIPRLDPNAEVGAYNVGFVMHSMIYLQDVRDDLSPGVHNVTIDIRGDPAANYIWKSSLFVQKSPM